jgi:Tfp pilus assembly pilus retraction ATPase PilT
MMEGADEGMQAFEQHASLLVEEGLITQEAAVALGLAGAIPRK